MTLSTVRVELGERSYPVIVGPGASKDIDAHLPAEARRAIVVTQKSVPFEVTIDRPHHMVFVGDGEQAKSLATVEALTRSFARFGLTRSDVVIAVGGGLVTDLAGFAAATWHRGTSYVNVPTTLLGMVDAAIGGKTAVNLPEGKNLVGAFWQPRAVLCDLDALTTLPEREMRCGLGEVAKYHFLTGADLLSMPIGERIAECAAVKASIVAEDEREGGRRAVLNYGHTLAHALETVGGHSMAHGEAVAVGILFAADLARRIGRIDDERRDLHWRVVRDEYRLLRPEHVAAVRKIEPAGLLETMARDKKAIVGTTFVLDGANGVEVVTGIDSESISSCLRDFYERLAATTPREPS